MTHKQSETFNVGLIQMRCGADWRANLEKAVSAVDKAAEQEAQIICLPELFATPYFCKRQDPDLFDLAEPIPGPTTRKIGEIAQKRQVVVVTSIFERRAPGIYHNSVVVLNVDGSIAGIYRKMHVPDDPLYYEKYYFTPGDRGYQVIDTQFAKIGTLICWDQWFPEAARLTALKGAEILLYPTAIGWHPSEKEPFGQQQLQAWETIQRSHAIANGTFVAAVNRVGIEEEAGDTLEFWGSTFVSDPFGVVLGRASVDKSEVLVVPCERKRITDVRRNWPFLRDRRIDTYGDLTRRYLDD